MASSSPASLEEQGEIRDDELLARCLLYALFFDGDRLSQQMLFKFWDATGPQGYQAESPAWRRYLPDNDDVHSYGCRVAVAQNEGREDRQPGSDKRRYYCGFMNGRAGDLRISQADYYTELHHKPENGEDAHVEIRLFVTAEGKSAARNARTAAFLELAAALGPPVPHTCECDLDDGMHPFKRFGEGCLELGAAA